MWNPLADKLKKEFRWDFIKGLAHDGKKDIPDIGVVKREPGQRIGTVEFTEETFQELEAEHAAVAHYETVTRGGQDGARK